MSTNSDDYSVHGRILAAISGPTLVSVIEQRTRMSRDQIEYTLRQLVSIGALRITTTIISGIRFACYVRVRA